jgi:Tol biopolymer transport system component
LGPAGTDTFVALSPDGKRAVVKDSFLQVPGDLWTVDLTNGLRKRLTFRKDVYSPGVWSPDGTRIAYAAGNLGDSLYEKASSGLDDESELLTEPGLRHFPTSWSRDGRFLLYHTENSPQTGYDLWVLPVRQDRKPVLLLGEKFNEWAGVFSPDMRWIAYASTENGGPRVAQVFVRPFRVSEPSGVPGLGEGKWQVSEDAGNWPRWRSDNEIIFNNGPPGTALIAAPVKSKGAIFESGVPQRLFAGPIFFNDVTMDGQRFLIAVPQVQKSGPTSVTVMLNWPALWQK